MSEAIVPGGERDLVLVQGVEPSLRWRTFSAAIVELAEALGVRLVVTVGALLADVPHTLPVAMTGFASDPALMDRPVSSPARVATRGRLASWVCCTPRPPACRPALDEPVGERAPLRRGGSLPEGGAGAGARLEESGGRLRSTLGELEEAADNYERQVGLAVSSNPEVQAFVERLEQERARRRRREEGGGEEWG